VSSFVYTSQSVHKFAVYGSQAGWGGYVSDEFYELFHVHILKRGWSVYDGTPVDILLLVEGYGIPTAELNKLKARHIISFHDDLHWHTKEQKDTKVNFFLACSKLNATFLMTYAPNFAGMYPSLSGVRPLWFPHSASNRFLRSDKPDTSRRWDTVLLTGSVSKLWYPLRAAALETLYVSPIPHPGYGPSDADKKSYFVGNMSQFAVGITSGSILNYTVAKFFEIPASGQLLMANTAIGTLLYRLGYTPWVHYIPYDERNLASTVVSVLYPGNRGRMRTIQEAGHTLVLSAAVNTHRVATTAHV
jgi:hypothetical protein